MSRYPYQSRVKYANADRGITAQTLWAKGIPIIRRQVNHRNWDLINTCPKCGEKVDPAKDDYHSQARSGGTGTRRYHRSCWESLFYG